jgi:ribosome-binding protein aMBF1 (putative translation factor)
MMKMPTIIAAPSKRRASVGRKRAEPDTSTYEGRFAARLGELLEARGLTPPQLADKLAKDKGVIYHWLAARYLPPLNDWPKLAKILRVEVSDLLPPK